MHRLLSFSIAVCALCASAGAAPPPALPQFATLTVADGLPSTAVYRVAQDHDGFIWVASHDGLARTDGIEFRVYRHDPDDPRSLSSNDVEALLVDRHGRIWCGGEASGLNLLDPDGSGFRHWRHVANDPSTLSSDDVWALAEDAAGTIWIGTYLGGLSALDANQHFSRIEHDPDDPASLRSNIVVALHVDRANRLWIGTDVGLDVREADGRIVHVALPPMDDRPGRGEVMAFLQEEDGSMLVGTGRGLFRVAADLSYAGEIATDPPFAVSALARDSDGTVWVGLLSGLARLDEGGVWRYPSGEPGPGTLPGKRVWDIISDAEGGLWFAVLDGGVARLPPDWRNFSVFRHVAGDAASLAHARVQGFGIGADAVWVISGRDGIDRIDLATGNIRRFGERFGFESGRLLWSVLALPGEIWIGHQGGIRVQHLDGGRAFDLPVDAQRDDALPPGLLDHMRRARGGDVWVVSRGGGVARLQTSPVRVLRRYVPRDGTLDNADITKLVLDAGDQPWIATTTGVRRLDRAGLRFVGVTGSPQEVVSGIAFAPDGTLWLQRLGALERYAIDDRTLVRTDRFDSDSGWPALAEGDLAVDRDGNVWATSPRGLWRAEPDTRRVRRFDQRDGLPGAEFLSNSLAVGADGSLYAGTLTGAVAFDPTALKQPTEAPPVRIVGLHVRRGGATIPLDPAKPIELGYKDRDLAVSVRALSYANASNNRYRFRLAGHDADWIESTSGEREFSRLPPGDYRLAVQGAGASGAWGTLETPLSIHVQPPPWATRWAYASYVLGILLAGAGLFGAYRARLRRRHALALAEERQRQAERLADAKTAFLATMSHEVRTPLTAVLGMAELLLGTRLDERQRNYAHAIHQSGELLLRQVNDSLDLARIEAGRLTLEAEALDPHALIEDILVLERPLAERKGLYLRNDCAADLPAMVVGDALRLKQILLNLVSNALKFTEQGGVTLRCERTSGGLAFEVADTGPGIPADVRARLFRRFEQADDSVARRHGGSGLGLAICRELAELMGGRIEADGEPGHGSVFRVELPLVDGAGPADAEPGATPARTAEPAIAVQAGPGDPPSPIGVSTRRNILLVEDDALVAAAVIGLLESLGHRARHASHGLAALAELKRNRFDRTPYDLAVLDLDLPGIDGLALARMIRKGVTGAPALPLIAATARSDGSEETRCRDAGFDGFLRKPLTAAGLDAEIARVFGDPVPQAREPDSAELAPST
jgi:signal transduction histidine kinase/CheY-like chemotaxis protein/sugar lactone lactonase YvrE